MARKRVGLVMEECNWDKIKVTAGKLNVSASQYVEMLIMQNVEYHEAMIKRLEESPVDEIVDMMRKLKGVL